MSWGLCFGGIGIGKCDSGDNTEVSTTFTQNNETVMELLNEVVQEFEANQESNVSGSNTTNIGTIRAASMVADGVGSENRISVTSDQSALIDAVSQITSLIEILQQTSASSDAKLDALATITAAAENTSVLASTSTASDTLVNNRTDIKQKNISKISNTLNQIAVVAGQNYMGLEGIDLGPMIAQNGGKNIVEVAITQKIEVYNKMLMDLVDTSSAIANASNSAQLKADIEEMLKTQQQGVIDSIGKGISEAAQGIGSGISDALGGLTKPLIYGAVAIVAVVLVIILFKFVFGKQQQPQVVYAPAPGMYGGGLDDPTDASVYDDL
jgi:hypothetical protein